MDGTFSIGNCKVLKETEKAIKIQSSELLDPMWIPKSQIHDDSEVWKKRH